MTGKSYLYHVYAKGAEVILEKVEGLAVAGGRQYIITKETAEFIVTKDVYSDYIDTYFNEEVYSLDKKKALDIFGIETYKKLVDAKKKVIMYDERLKGIDKYENK